MRDFGGYRPKAYAAGRKDVADEIKRSLQL